MSPKARRYNIIMFFFSRSEIEVFCAFLSYWYVSEMCRLEGCQTVSDGFRHPRVVTEWT